MSTDTKPATPFRQPAAALNHQYLQQQRFYKRLQPSDWGYALVLLAAALFVQLFFSGHRMDAYETAILWGCTFAAIALGWFFKPIRWFVPTALILAYAAVKLYGGQFAAGQNSFLLRYFLSSQSAIMWQCTLIVLAFGCYLVGTLAALRRTAPSGNMPFSVADALAWAAALAGLVGLLVRWHESYLLRPDAGHIPVSNLYEVFILFMVITALMYQYYSQKFHLEKLGAFVYFFQTLLVGFVVWYSVTRHAQEIQPLIPALQSWWIKIHVPANFIGYGAFCMAAMFAAAQLLALNGQQQAAQGNTRSLAMRFGHILPAPHVIEEAMYKAIAVGFLFFTIATILGALWAAEAWGRYWSWDPKETWAFIVWLNYAIWLHMRLVAGWRGKILAWWALAGLLITAFAFLGVNMFLSGLHSYGKL